MSLTPEYLKAGTSKISPFCSGGISKKFLTPCRQMGLSRKVKTPKCLVKSASDDIIVTSLIQDLNSTHTTTPVTHRKSLERQNSDIPLSSSKTLEPEELEVTPKNLVKTVIKAKERRVSKKLLMDLEEEKLNNTDIGSKCEVMKVVTQKLVPKKLSVNSVAKLLVEDQIPKNKLENIVSKDVEKKDEMTLKQIDFKKKISDASKKIPKNPVPEGKSGKRSLEESNIVHENKKKIRRTLSLKKTSSNSEEEPIVKHIEKQNSSFTVKNDDEVIVKSVEDQRSIYNVKSCRVQLEKLSKESVDKLDEKLLAIIDSEEDYAFTTTPESRTSFLQQIKLLENQVKSKEIKLEKLKQAKVYKKLHNIDELQEVTKKWTGGCEAALKVLLEKVQIETPEIDMPTLLKNFKIPTEIVANLKIFE